MVQAEVERRGPRPACRPKGSRRPGYWERDEDGKKQKEAKPVAKWRFDVLGGADGTPGLVEAVVKEIGFDWSAVKDVGKLPVREA